MRDPGFRLSIRGVTLFRVVPFVGAGWSWPSLHCQKWMLGIYFHCGRGLYIQFGHCWLFDYGLKRSIKEMTQQEREELGRVLSDALKTK